MSFAPDAYDTGGALRDYPGMMLGAGEAQEYPAPEAADGQTSNAGLEKPELTVVAHTRSALVEQLYRQHWRDLCRRLRRLYGNGPPDPEDLAQAAFEKFAQIEDHDRIQHPRAFLFRTAVNLGLNAIDRIRTAKRFIERELVVISEPVLEENTPEDVYSIQERLNLIARAMEKLTVKQKQILVRSRFRGETYAQIAAETGWSQADISRQLNAALKTLQQVMADAEGSEEDRR